MATLLWPFLAAAARRSRAGGPASARLITAAVARSRAGAAHGRHLRQWTDTTKAWASATFAVYPATNGASPTHRWLRLDDVVVRREEFGRSRTECFEAGARFGQ
jgi:hypothetical protein